MKGLVVAGLVAGALAFVCLVDWRSTDHHAVSWRSQRQQTQDRSLLRYYSEYKNACPLSDNEEPEDDCNDDENSQDKVLQEEKEGWFEDEQKNNWYEEQDKDGEVDMSNIPTLESMDDFTAMQEASHQTPVLVAFMTTWCPNSRKMKPVLVGLPETHGDAILVYQVDMDEYPDVAAAGHVPAIPTFHIYVNGEPVDTQVGANEDGLNQMVQSHKKK